MNATGLTVCGAIHFEREGKGSRKVLKAGPEVVLPRGRVPLVSRLMALALKFEGLVRDEIVTDYAELARLGHVTRSRVSQIMSLLHLAPDIQEAILFLPKVDSGRAPIILRDLQPIATTPDWRKQRKLWQALLARVLLRGASLLTSTGSRRADLLPTFPPRTVRQTDGIRRLPRGPHPRMPRPPQNCVP